MLTPCPAATLAHATRLIPERRRVGAEVTDFTATVRVTASSSVEWSRAGILIAGGEDFASDAEKGSATLGSATPGAPIGSSWLFVGVQQGRVVSVRAAAGGRLLLDREYNLAKAKGTSAPAASSAGASASAGNGADNGNGSLWVQVRRSSGGVFVASYRLSESDPWVQLPKEMAIDLTPLSGGVRVGLTHTTDSPVVGSGTAHSA